MHKYEFCYTWTKLLTKEIKSFSEMREKWSFKNCKRNSSQLINFWQLRDSAKTMFPFAAVSLRLLSVNHHGHRSCRFFFSKKGCAKYNKTPIYWHEFLKRFFQVSVLQEWEIQIKLLYFSRQRKRKCSSQFVLYV